jgi:hypothetical protein
MFGRRHRGIALLVAAFVFALAAQPAGAAVLHDQFAPDPGGANVNSQNFEASLNAYDDLGADDFVVPPGTIWRIDRIEVSGQNSGAAAATANIFLFADAGSLPGGQLFAHPNLPIGLGLTYPDLDLPISDLPALGPGRYWLGVQANRDFSPGTNNWWWSDHAPQFGQPAAFRQPGDGFSGGCTTFQTRKDSACYPDSGDTPDQAFRLDGTASVLDLLGAKAKSAKKVKLTVDVPIAGALTVTGSKLKPKQLQVAEPGQITVGLKTKRAARDKLANGKRVKTTIDLSLVPPLGQALTDEDQRKLRLKRRG